MKGMKTMETIKPGDIFWTRANNLYLVLEPSDLVEEANVFEAMLIGGDDMGTTSGGRTWQVGPLMRVADEFTFEPLARAPARDAPGVPFVLVIGGEEYMVVLSRENRLYGVDGRFLGRIEELISWENPDVDFYSFKVGKFGGFPAKLGKFGGFPAKLHEAATKLAGT